MPKNYLKRLGTLDKDLQEKVKRAVDKEKTLISCEEISLERSKKDYLKEHYSIIGELPKSDYDRIFVYKKWSEDLSFIWNTTQEIKRIVSERIKKKEENIIIKKLDDSSVELKKAPLKLKINGSIQEVKFFIFRKTDTEEITEKKWEVIKNLSENLKGDIVRIYRLLKFFNIPINTEKRGKNQYVFGVKNLNLKKRRIYIATKQEYSFAIEKYENERRAT